MNRTALALGAVVAIVAAFFYLRPAPAEQEDHPTKAEISEKAEADRKAREAARDAEAQLFADQVRAKAEIELRMSRWIRQENGAFHLIDRAGSPNFKLFAISKNAPWHVSCDARGLTVEFLGALSISVRGGEGDASPEISREITRTRLSENQCGQAVQVATSYLQTIIHSGQAPK